MSVYIKDRGFNSFACSMIKLSVSETKWSSRQNPRSYSLYLDLNIWFRAQKVTGPETFGEELKPHDGTFVHYFSVERSQL